VVQQVLAAGLPPATVLRVHAYPRKHELDYADPLELAGVALQPVTFTHVLYVVEFPDGAIRWSLRAKEWLYLLPKDERKLHLGSASTVRGCSAGDWRQRAARAPAAGRRPPRPRAQRPSPCPALLRLDGACLI
jgi:hypothetical protein